MVEIMIVVAVIGLLAGIGIPNFIKSRTRSQLSTCLNNLRQIDAAVHQWALEHNNTDGATVQYDDISGYLKSSVVCPAGGTSFADSYAITVVGEDPECIQLPDDHFLTEMDDAGTPQPNRGHHGHGHGKP